VITDLRYESTGLLLGSAFMSYSDVAAGVSLRYTVEQRLF